MKQLIGRYCKYKGEHYLVYKDNGRLIGITNPRMVGARRNIQVKPTSVKFTKHTPAVVVEHRGEELLVTGLEMIINHKGRELKWSGTHPERLAILRAAEQRRLLDGTARTKS